MSKGIGQLNEEVVKEQIKELVRGSVEETLNELLDAEVNKLTQAARFERNEQWQGYLPQRSLQSEPHHDIRGRDVAGTTPERRDLRESHHQAIPPSREQRGGSTD